MSKSPNWYSNTRGNPNLETCLIFTDGACEGDVPPGSIGGVLAAPNHQVVHHFGCLTPNDVMSLFHAHSSHPIHELEMITILVSFQFWRDLLQGCQVVHYIDNESVRMVLLRCSGETPVARMVANSIMTAEFESRTKSWYARVARHSNMAEAPNSLDFDQLNSPQSTFFLRWTGMLCS
jgi:ribonuclease HI